MTRRDPWLTLAAIGAVATVTVVYFGWLHVTNATTVALTFLLIVLVVAATSRLWIAVATSFAAMACFNYFFLPPVRTFTVADPQNWVALFAFLAVSLVASRLSSLARIRADEAVARRDELARLFDLSRDVLLTTESREAMALLARVVGRRFDLTYAAICLPRGDEWEISEAPGRHLSLDPAELMVALRSADATLEFDARSRAYVGHRMVEVDGERVQLVPLRHGTHAVGLLAAAGRAIEPGTLDALAGLAAIAVERAHFLEERKAAELARQRDELKSALLASLGHDLRTPLTAIRIAASNLQAAWLSDEERRDQSEIVLTEVEQLTRLFHNIVEMARIDAGAVAAEPRWVHTAEIVEAARDQVTRALKGHRIELGGVSPALVRLDPRLTAAALAHVLENAAQYSPTDAPIGLSVMIDGDGVAIRVRDRGPGIAASDLPHLFERFYRGESAARHETGTGMGLAIARGLLAAQGGRIWAENCVGGGAQFSIIVPGETKPESATAAEISA